MNKPHLKAGAMCLKRDVQRHYTYRVKSISVFYKRVMVCVVCTSSRGGAIYQWYYLPEFFERFVLYG